MRDAASSRLRHDRITSPWVQAIIVLLATISGCGTSSDDATRSNDSKTDVPKLSGVAADNPAGGSSLQAPERPLQLSIAASTRDVIERLASEFTRETNVPVLVNAGASSSLAAQLEAGAPADLFLSASPQWADVVAKSRAAVEVRPLLSNRLVLVVPKDNPGMVSGPQDLLTARVTRVALAGEKVPAGVYAEQALAKLELMRPLMEQNRIARGRDVVVTLGFVARGEAEAGIVYATDARDASDIRVVHTFDPALHEPIVYSLVLLPEDGGAAHPAARRFFEFLVSPRAAAEYDRSGYLPASVPDKAP